MLVENFGNIDDILLEIVDPTEMKKIGKDDELDEKLITRKRKYSEEFL